MMGQDYFLGLDMGTGSLGWAVTNDRYEIQRKHGKDLWGVRLFESASTAEERRMFRTARRRLGRRNWRIQVLQELFSEEISKIDPGFYLRMKESKYYPEDKRGLDGNCPDLPYALFVDHNYTDKNYHKEFPTIYHLRKYLMETENTPDIRLVYLAIHHMMKHRGHFLLAGDNISQIKEFKGTFLQLTNNLKAEELDWELEIEEDDIKYVETVLKNKELTKTAKKTTLIKTLQAKKTCEKAILTLLSGGTVKLSDIFGNEELNECERSKISFSDSGYDDYIGTVEADLGEQYYIIESAKAVYDWSVLVEILGDSASISEAKVKAYEKHKQDLKYLKKVVHKCLSAEDYKEIFVETNDKLKNYCAYVGKTKKNGKKVDLQSKQCSKDEFYDFLKKNVIKNIKDDEIREYLEQEIEQGTFLPKQVTKDNGVIPYQVHEYELKQILNNLEVRIPFIRENKEKILQLFEFRIPYYVGPLNWTDGKEKDFTWAVRRSKEKIYPWNFRDVIDVETSAEKFIRRMTNKCTYLAGEDVLPKDSLLYSKYMVLNELNNLRLNGEKPSVELKQRIYKEVFCRYRKVTLKKLKRYLKCQGIAGEDVEITGIDGNFKAQLTSYHDFKEKLTNVTLSQKAKEEIILNIVLFGDDKKLLKQRLQRLYPELTDSQLKSISLLSYKGWGRFSRTFLENITAPAPETGEVWNIITALWETNDNLMQLLGGNYKFAEEIENFNASQQTAELTYKTVENMYVSPAVKRQIWQTLKVIKELQKVMGKDPQRVFVEMAREKQESKRKESRKKYLVDLYKTCKKEESELWDELQKCEEHQLRSDKLYLYYTQMGRCMYSGERIELDDLWDNNKYDIDHIYPQSKTMDDSLNNRVLVKKQLNSNKTDIYPISKDIRDKRTSFWKILLNKGFISKKKYERLTRATELTPDDLAGFIERQLVETRQSTKAVAEVLKQALPNTEIVYVKAGNVSRFRKDFDLIKVRDMNDLHHAKDAYLNIVVGNSYYVRFTKNAARYVKENPGRSYNLKKMFKSDDPESGKDIVRNGEVAWKAGSKGTIGTVKKFMNKNSILVTRKAYEVKGGLFDQMIMKKGKGQIPIKGIDERLANIEKYGGYNKATGAYFMLVKSKDKKNKEIRTLEYIPVYMKDQIEKDEIAALTYLKEIKQLKDPEILIKKIKTDTLFKADGFKMWLSGRTGTQLIFKGANQLILPMEDTQILKKVVKYITRKKENKDVVLNQRDELTEEMLVKLYDTFIGKIQNTVYGIRLMTQAQTLTEKRENFLKLSCEDKCIVLNEILHMFQCRSGAANLKMIGGPGSAGLLYLNSNITKYKKLSIINQSVTGVYQNEVDLLTV